MPIGELVEVTTAITFSGHDARRLEGRQFLSDLLGREVHDVGEVVGRHLYAAEGEDDLHTDRMGKEGEDCDRGHWWIEGDRWYRQWRQWAYGEPSGYAVVVDGDQLRWYGEDGFLADTAVLIRPAKRRAR